LILRKIIKIVDTGCRILKLKCTNFDFGWGSTPDPAGGDSTRPAPWLDLTGPISKGREKGREGRLREEEKRGEGIYC